MKSKILLALILLLALAHLGMVLPAIAHPERFRIVDSDQYVDLASNLLKSGHYQGQAFAGIDLVRTPGYPLFLALGMLLFSDVRWISLLQVLLLLANGFSLYRIAAELGYKKAGAAAVLIYLLSINAAFEALNILTETLTAFWLILSLWLLVRFWSTEKGAWLLPAGLCLGIGALTRPIVFPLFIIWAIVLVVFRVWRTKKPVLRRQDLGNLALFLSGGLLLILLWSARNYAVHRVFTLSNVAGITLQDFIVAIPVSEVNHVSLEQAKDLISSSPNASAYILAFIKAHPVPFVKAQVRGILLTLTAVSYPSWAYVMTGIRPASTGIVASLSFDLTKIVDQLRAGNLWIASGVGAILYDLVLFGMCLVATVRIFARRRQAPLFEAGLVVLITLAYMLVTPLAQGSGRFRIPVEPYLALLAALVFVPRASARTDQTR